MIQSAGLLIFNFFNDELKVLLVHPGGPYWANRKEEGWGIPKGRIEGDESPYDAAIRETQEELGQLPLPVPTEVYDLGEVKQSSKKTVYCFAVRGMLEKELNSMMTEVEWPSGSGKMISVPEIGEMRWVTPEEAKDIIILKQYVFIERLVEKLNERGKQERVR